MRHGLTLSPFVLFLVFLSGIAGAQEQVTLNIVQAQATKFTNEFFTLFFRHRIDVAFFRQFEPDI